MNVKKKRWDVDHCESFLGKKGRANIGCCLSAVKTKDLVLTQAADIDGCRTQRRSCRRIKEENLSPLSDKELEGAACVDFLEALFCLHNLLVWTPWPVRITSYKQLLQLNKAPSELPEVLANLQVHNKVQDWTPGQWESCPSHSQCHHLLALSISPWLVQILVFTKLKRHKSFVTHLYLIN